MTPPAKSKFLQRDAMKCDFFGDFLPCAWAIHADGDKWADRGGSALAHEKLRRGDF
jgi:hypothetical protein